MIAKNGDKCVKNLILTKDIDERIQQGAERLKIKPSQLIRLILVQWLDGDKKIQSN